MKKFFINTYNLILAFFSVTFMFVSCTKDSDGSPEVKPGNMQFSAIAVDSGANGAVVTIKGSGMGDIRSIVFEKENVPASFIPTLNTESAIVFRVPDTAKGGVQKIILTNSQGKSMEVPFRVLAYAVVTEVSTYDFSQGSRITLTGINMADVTKVVLAGTNNEAKIVSQTKNTLILEMPQTTISRAPLQLTNSTGTSTTSQEFVSMDNNIIAFDEEFGKKNPFGGDIQSWSYGVGGVGPSSEEAKVGAKSLKVEYKDGALSMFLGASWEANNRTFSQAFASTFISFWAKSLDSDVEIEIRPDSPWAGTNMWGGPAATGTKKFTIVKDKWTYYKIPMNFISGHFSRLNFAIVGGTNKTVFYDNILFVK